jgi:CubicO group peptidase (beta-lactamase class C family)
MLLLPSCQQARFVVYNFADINDHKKFPERSMLAASQPWRFATPAEEKAPKSITVNGEEKVFGEFLEERKTVAFLIIRNDTMLYEHYFSKYDSASVVPSFSMAKSVTSLLIGCAIADGYIGSEDDVVSKYLPEMAENGFDRVSIRHLLQMTAGIDFNESYVNPFGDVAAFYYGRRLRRATLNVNLAEAPGTSFEYSSGSTQILGLLLESVLPEGQSITDYLELKIWKPLEMEFDAGWSIDKEKDGLEKTFCCINARARDYAKLGKLMLQKGAWDGQQVVPANWVEKCTAVDTSEGSAWYYQYQWWLSSKHGDFYAQGILGQYIYVDPASNMVIVRLGKKNDGVGWVGVMRSLAAAYKLKEE